MKAGSDQSWHECSEWGDDRRAKAPVTLTLKSADTRRQQGTTGSDMGTLSLRHPFASAVLRRSNDQDSPAAFHRSRSLVGGDTARHSEWRVNLSWAFAVHLVLKRQPASCAHGAAPTSAPSAHSLAGATISSTCAASKCFRSRSKRRCVRWQDQAMNSKSRCLPVTAVSTL